MTKPPTRRKILFITGTRADFGKMKPLMEQVKRSKDFDYAIFVTGMHMLSRYGSTVNEIRKAGFGRMFTHISQVGSSESQMDLVLANTIQGLGHYLREYPADLIVVHGDRIETLAGAVVGALNNVLIAHIEGGEVSGTVDELIRHAVTKLSHVHFVSNDEARDRLVQMGEAPTATFVIGSPDIDVMFSDTLPSLTEVKRRYAIKHSEYGILAYHPVTTEVGHLRTHIETVLDAAEASGLSFVAIYPNNDTGANIILESFGRIRDNPRFRVIPSMRFEHYLTLLKYARVIVGNSSAGVREAPALGVPTVNIGTRQMNRFSYPSILDVPEDKDAILHALNNLPTSVRPSLHFGRGESAKAFMAVLRSATLWQTSRQKQFRDIASSKYALERSIQDGEGQVTRRVRGL